MEIYFRRQKERRSAALDATTGKEIWKTSLPITYQMHEAATGHGKGPKSTPVVSRGTIYTFGISGVLSAHDAETGKLKWRHEFSKTYPKTSPLFGTAMSPIVEGGVLIAHVEDTTRRTHSLRRETVRLVANEADGRGTHSARSHTWWSAPVVTSAERFCGRSFATGKLLWNFRRRLN